MTLLDSDLITQVNLLHSDLIRQVILATDFILLDKTLCDGKYKISFLVALLSQDSPQAESKTLKWLVATHDNSIYLCYHGYHCR